MHESFERKTAFKLMEDLRDKGFIVESKLITKLSSNILEDSVDTKRILMLNDDRVELIDIEKDQTSDMKLDEFIKGL